MKPLLETNPFLKDKKTREKLIERSVRTSCGVEGLRDPNTIIEIDCSEEQINKIVRSALLVPLGITVEELIYQTDEYTRPVLDKLIAAAFTARACEEFLEHDKKHKRISNRRTKKSKRKSKKTV